MWLLVEANTSSAPAHDTLVLAIISGVVAIAVAFIGYLGVKANRQQRNNLSSNPPPTNEEPWWVKDLRADNASLRATKDRDQDEIDRLQRMLFLAGIDPTTGVRIQGRHGRISGRQQGPTPTPAEEEADASPP